MYDAYNESQVPILLSCEKVMCQIRDRDFDSEDAVRPWERSVSTPEIVDYVCDGMLVKWQISAKTTLKISKEQIRISQIMGTWVCRSCQLSGCQIAMMKKAGPRKCIAARLLLFTSVLWSLLVLYSYC